MLALTRKPHEEVVLVTDQGIVRVSIARILGNAVKIGVDAPQGIRVYRGEVWVKIEAAMKGGSDA